jgi:hypothetical protein
MNSLSIVNDPSIRELEEVSALFETGMALLFLIHAFALFVISRRWFELQVPCVLGVALICVGVVSGALLQVPGLTIPGAYPLSIVVGVAILGWITRFGWVSLYLGSGVGCLMAWYVAAPVSDAFACLFVTAPCVIYAFIGAGVSRGLAYISGRDAKT